MEIVFSLVRYVVFIFQAGNPDHMRMVKDMGISILTLPDGRVQLLHTFANVSSHISVCKARYCGYSEGMYVN